VIARLATVLLLLAASPGSGQMQDRIGRE